MFVVCKVEEFVHVFFYSKLDYFSCHSFTDKSPLKSAPTCVAWQPDVDHSYAVGGECGHLVIKDTRSPVSECVSMVPHRRPITRIQFSNNK